MLLALIDPGCGGQPGTQAALWQILRPFGKFGKSEDCERRLGRPHAMSGTRWPIFLPAWLRKKRSLGDAFQENQVVKEQKELFDLMSRMCEDGCDTDEIRRPQ